MEHMLAFRNRFICSLRWLLWCYSGSKPQCLVTVVFKHPEIWSLYFIHHKYDLPHHSSPLRSLKPHFIAHTGQERKLASLCSPFTPAGYANSAWPFWELLWGICKYGSALGFTYHLSIFKVEPLSATWQGHVCPSASVCYSHGVRTSEL